MRLCPIYVASFIDPFQPADAVLLIELGTLSKVGDAVKILQLEEIGDSLSARWKSSN